MLCKNCGTSIKEGGKFCPQCGQAVPVAPRLEAAAIVPKQAAETAKTVTEPETLPADAIQEAITKQYTCKKCGAQIKEGAKFCTSCGNPADAVTAQAIPEMAEPNETPGGEPDDNAGIIAETNRETPPPVSGIGYLAQEGNQGDAENRKIAEDLKNTKSGLTAAIVIGAAGILIAIAVGYNQYNLMESRLRQAESDLRQTEPSLLPINVTAIKVGNTAQDKTWLTNPGERLVSSQMRYLRPVITYNTTLDAEITFYVKIIQPNGNLDYNSSESPKGYSYATTARLTRGNNQTLTLSGWGNADRSNYRAGEWTVEVWYSDAGVCFRSEKVTIE
jgi:RNA polymerase subunit RPABC4/transcription elongation factor Spt4